uniref:Glutaredoxin n=1 Tax=Sporolithon durum TaxID=48970 RepID=A0A141SCY8_9FLOR|nr:hypothetical protein Sdur_106 [Sporolithon durum]AMK96156.1 hypothetical protein Sdur_106 [Sporolithon durum]
MNPETKKTIKNIINNSTIVVFMKGSKEMPLCGFSSRVIQILNILELVYSTIDVLKNPSIRSGIKEYSKWPTIPQVYVNGEFIGGADIITELYQKSKLQETIEKLINS